MSEARQKENSLLLAYKKAAAILQNSQPPEICRKSGAEYRNGSYKIAFMGTYYEIKMPEVKFSPPPLPTIVEVLILHYLTSNENRPVKDNFISFSGIPGGMFYFKSFQQRALNRLVGSFRENPERLLEAGMKLSGKKWTTGDYSVIIPIFPKIEMAVQIFTADEEFPPEANILYSGNAVNFLPAEDAAFLGGYLAGKLSAALG